MIQSPTPNLLQTTTATFHVESTLRGGHLVRVSSIPSDWTGLYRYESSLVLIARCCGAPPGEIPVSVDMRTRLLEMIRSVCTCLIQRAEPA